MYSRDLQSSSEKSRRGGKPFLAPKGGCPERVLVPNVVYLMNIPESIASDEILRSLRYLGQYGRIEKIILHKNGTAHATFASINSAQTCIKCLDNFMLNGARISALVGTTKYPEDVDLKKIMENSVHEPLTPPAANPVFPSPHIARGFMLSLPKQPETDLRTRVTENSIQQNQIFHQSMFDHNSFPHSQTCMQQNPESDNVLIRPNTGSMEDLVFGTGGLVHKMWLDSSSGLPSPRSETSSQSSRSRSSSLSTTIDAFIPRPLIEQSSTSARKPVNVSDIIVFQDDIFDVDCVPSTPFSARPSVPSTPEPTTGFPRFALSSNSATSTPTSAGSAEDFWSSSSGSVNGDQDCDESSQVDDLVTTTSSSNLSIETETMATGTSTGLSFSPSKEMIKALSAHVWKPAEKPQFHTISPPPALPLARPVHGWASAPCAMFPAQLEAPLMPQYHSLSGFPFQHPAELMQQHAYTHPYAHHHLLSQSDFIY